MSYWKVFLKLMSKHWRSHLGWPVFVGIVVETVIGWVALKDRSFNGLREYVLSPEGLMTHMSIFSLIITFLSVTVYLVHKDAKRPWTNDATRQLDQLFRGAKSFFATCTIPLEDWFHPNIQRYFSHLVKHRLRGQTFPQHRVLLFKSEADLERANEQYLDAQYAKPLADMHENYMIPLGYLGPAEIGTILQDFNLTGKAAVWKSSKVQNETDRSNDESKGSISTLDFGLIGYGNDQYQVYTFAKTGDFIRLKKVKNPTPYLHLRDEIRKRVFSDRGLPDADHDFAAHVGLPSLEIEQSFVDQPAASPSTEASNSHRELKFSPQVQPIQARDWDVIVIGVGGMGSATAYQLASRGRKVLAIEQNNIPNDLGSSHGVNRIIRLGYAEGKKYVPLLLRAYCAWRDLESRFGEKLLFITGGIDAGPEDSLLVKGTLASCTEYNLDHEILTSDQLSQRFPGFCLPTTLTAVYQRESGFVLSERSIIAHVSLALESGAEIHAREQVLYWKVQKGMVTVQTNRASYRAARLVITAGPWAGQVVEQIRGVVNPERQVLLWSQPKQPELFRMGAFPVFYMQDDEDEKFYGFPIFGMPGFKIGKYNHLKQQVDPNTMDRDCHDYDERVLREAIRKYFPNADGPTIAMKTCLFSNTEDEHFILDRHPEFQEVSIAAGFSGHGYKFCPVIGEIMADLALEGGSKSFDLNPFRLSRLLPQR
jgi:sarcosine oxidase